MSGTHLQDLVAAFADMRVVVVGEAMLDRYLEGHATRVGSEAPVPIVHLSSRNDVPGGAANTAVNVADLGGRVALLTVIGDDPEGGALRQALAAHGVETGSMITEPGRATPTKNRVLASGHLLVRFDQGATGPIGPTVEERLIARLEALYADADAVIVSDYGHGVVTDGVVRALARLQARSPHVVTVDAKDLLRYRSVGVTAVKPNYQEAAGLLGLDGDLPSHSRLERVTASGERLLDLLGCHVAAVTLDSDGALVFEHGHPPYRTYARPVRGGGSVIGAGDTFVSALTLALAAGANTPFASELASAAADVAAAAAAVVVSKEETATCSAAELVAHLAADDKQVDGLAQLVARVQMHRRLGRRIVFTNGVFDIIHRGHITYLNRAKTLGDVLIVGVNSDESVRRLKGPERPINSLRDRIDVLAAMSSVDMLIAFDDDIPARIVEAVRPDVFVKGGDYTRETLPEAGLVERLGGEVAILPYVEDRSTTGIISRIRGQYASAGAPERSGA